MGRALQSFSFAILGFVDPSELAQEGAREEMAPGVIF